MWLLTFLAFTEVDLIFFFFVTWNFAQGDECSRVAGVFSYVENVFFHVANMCIHVAHVCSRVV